MASFLEISESIERMSLGVTTGGFNFVITFSFCDVHSLNVSCHQVCSAIICAFHWYHKVQCLASLQQQLVT